MAGPVDAEPSQQLECSTSAASTGAQFCPEDEKKIEQEEGVKHTWKEMWCLQDFRASEVWMAGLIELWVTGLMVFISGATAYALNNQTRITSPFLLPLLGGLLAGTSLTLFIFVALPASGGHVNPLITLGSFAIRATSLPRTIIYILAQTVGATAGAGVLHAAIGGSLTSTSIPGCTWNPEAGMARLQVFIMETAGCVIVLWVAFVSGLDPRQGKVFGRVLGPMLIGLALGICIFVTAIVKPGYSGAGMNPARCFGLLAATGDFRNHYIQWAGTVVAAFISGVVYLAMPPYISARVVALPLSA